MALFYVVFKFYRHRVNGVSKTGDREARNDLITRLTEVRIILVDNESCEGSSERIAERTFILFHFIFIY